MNIDMSTTETKSPASIDGLGGIHSPNLTEEKKAAFLRNIEKQAGKFPNLESITTRIQKLINALPTNYPHEQKEPPRKPQANLVTVEKELEDAISILQNPQRSSEDVRKITTALRELSQALPPRASMHLELLAMNKKITELTRYWDLLKVEQDKEKLKDSIIQ